MKRRLMMAIGAGALLAHGFLAAPSQAQVPTGTISGRITASGEAVPGVLVTASSPALQGERSTNTEATGDYLLPLLPPGEYELSYELDGFQTLRRTVKVNAAQTAALSLELEPGSVAEEIVVTGNLETISATPTTAVTRPVKLIEELPVARTVVGTALLTPGVMANGPNNGLVINGAMSFENLFMINGVVINENLRGQPHNAFIEDAIAETTVLTSGVSAEYGRFTGGVVNVLTKSGGNEFAGTVRSSVTNDKWSSATPVTTGERVDDVNQQYEATLGGPILRDQLWFFLAGRDLETTESAQTGRTGLAFESGSQERRLEAKLTASIGPRFRLVGSYLENNLEEFGNTFPSDAGVADLRSVDDRELPTELRTANLSSVWTPNFFTEAQYSQKNFSFIGSGGDARDRINGTFILDRRTGVRFNSPTFCGVCTDEERNNENALVKGSWFLSTAGAGTHEMAVGVDRFTDVRISDNHQSGSSFSVWAGRAFYAAQQQPVPQFLPNFQTWIVQYPILESTKGTDFVTNSLYANDQWRVSDRLTVNLGARYDQNDGVDSAGKTVAEDSRISPRLGATYDLQGDGDWLVHASAGDYVAALAGGVANDTSAAGTPAIFAWFYLGPAVNADANGPFVSSADALRTVFDWFDSVGGVNNQDFLFFVDIPGGTSRIQDGGLRSPAVREYKLGVSRRLGTRGTVRADLIRRDWSDFYSERVDATTGAINTPNGLTDLTIIENNDDVLSRRYEGLMTQVDYRFDRWQFGGFYTLSRLQGNFIGETTGSGPVSSSLRSYPEYKEARWFAPEGDLPADQRHRLRAWALWRALATERHSLTISALQAFDSGTPYGAVGVADVVSYRPDFGYQAPPTDGETYYFTSRDAFRTPTVTSTSLSLNYAFRAPIFGRDIEVFLQPEVLNVFDEQSEVAVDTTIDDASTDGALAAFDPFRETPVEGVHWRKAETFGKGVDPTDFQTPRTFRFSVGFRF